jgi:hypothetical protein
MELDAAANLIVNVNGVGEGARERNLAVMETAAGRRGAITVLPVNSVAK